jgi:hypothetical protein
MKLIKANQLLSVPVDGLEPSNLVRMELVQPGRYYPVHDKTITWLGNAKFEIINLEKEEKKKKDVGN